MKKAARFVVTDEKGRRCQLCPHACLLQEDVDGICRVRGIASGEPETRNYGLLSALAVDPIEKKPLYHFKPGTTILSAGTVGCNLRCPFCQNWQISQEWDRPLHYLSPEELARKTFESGTAGLAFTYSEPVVWYEYVYDTARLVRNTGLATAMITNGYINKEPLAELLPFMDAFNVDLKSFNDDTYRKVLAGRLEPVLNSIRQIYEYGAHLEVTTLVVTGMNDSIEELMEIAEFIASIDPAIPWHVSKYHPSYNYREAATDDSLIHELYRRASEVLSFVYTGNMAGGHGDTVCPSCGEVVISRRGFSTDTSGLQGNCCMACGEKVVRL